MPTRAIICLPLTQRRYRVLVRPGNLRVGLLSGPADLLIRPLLHLRFIIHSRPFPPCAGLGQFSG